MATGPSRPVRSSPGDEVRRCHEGVASHPAILTLPLQRGLASSARGRARRAAPSGTLPASPLCSALHHAPHRLLEPSAMRARSRAVVGAKSRARRRRPCVDRDPTRTARSGARGSPPAAAATRGARRWFAEGEPAVAARPSRRRTSDFAPRTTRVRTTRCATSSTKRTFVVRST